MFFQTLVFLNSVLVKKFDENILMLTFLAKNFLMANMFVPTQPWWLGGRAYDQIRVGCIFWYPDLIDSVYIFV